MCLIVKVIGYMFYLTVYHLFTSFSLFNFYFEESFPLTKWGWRLRIDFLLWLEHIRLNISLFISATSNRPIYGIYYIM